MSEKAFKAAIREVLDEKERSRRGSVDASVTVAIIGLVGVVVTALVPSILPGAEQPEVSACVESYREAIQMVERDGVYLALPEDHPEEKQCDVNGRVIELYDLPAGKSAWEIEP